MRTIKITITDEDGVLLDSTTAEIGRKFNGIAWRPVQTESGPRPDEELMNIGNLPD